MELKTPKALPSLASSPTSTGTEAMKGKMFDTKATEEIRIGASGCTVVRPIRAKTTT